jgi:hypothetical protein
MKTMNITGILVLGVATLAACSSEPRSKLYFEQHPDEARNLIDDKSACVGPDRTKIVTGEDECTNAHQAIKSLEVAEYNEQQHKANSKAAKSGGFTPKLKQK